MAKCAFLVRFDLLYRLVVNSSEPILGPVATNIRLTRPSGNIHRGEIQCRGVILFVEA